MTFGCLQLPKIKPIGSKMLPKGLQGAPKTAQMELKGIKVKPWGTQKASESLYSDPQETKNGLEVPGCSRQSANPPSSKPSSQPNIQPANQPERAGGRGRSPSIRRASP